MADGRHLADLLHCNWIIVSLVYSSEIPRRAHANAPKVVLGVDGEVLTPH